MIFSRSTEYAIRAFLYLAGQEPGRLIMARHIAEQASLPSHFLAKLLQQLARKGLVKSNKGPSGGFTLGMPPKEISLYRIIDAVDGVEALSRCPLGHVRCTAAKDCPMHDGWMRVRSRIVDYLEHTSLADVSGPDLPSRRRSTQRVKSSSSKA
ncbi:MAG TPA: Rrf2 family transcriptional regulator [Bryobacteraceae bacterium]|nr:Rrf2 family transcriptional regulator [Bryobacteraceae bacterium]